MGRSAAGGGGSSSSSGGGRSSGGSSRSSGGHRHSSSSRSARSSSSSSYSSSSRSSSGYSSNRYVRNTYYGGSRNYNNRDFNDDYYGSSYDSRRTNNTTLSQCILIFIIIFAAMLLAGTFVSVNKSKSIPYSTVQREALDKSNVTVSKYYDDNLGWISSKAKVNKGMEYFFDKTGVQPYLLITDNINGDKWPSDEKIDEYLNNVYNKEFVDEQHIILLYLDNGNEWLTHYLCGKTAKNVMDQEACEIMLSYFDYYATSDMDDDDYFSTSFKKSADRIMSFGKTDNRFIYLAAGGLCVIALLVILFFVIRHKEKVKSLEVEELKVADSILNAGVLKDTDLKDKYKEGN